MKLKDKSILQNICRIQNENSVKSGFCCFIAYMIAEKSLLGSTNFIFSNSCEKNVKIIHNYFSLDKSRFYTAQKMKFSITDFVSKFDQISSFLLI